MLSGGTDPLPSLVASLHYCRQEGALGGGVQHLLLPQALLLSHHELTQQEDPYFARLPDFGYLCFQILKKKILFLIQLLHLRYCVIVDERV